MRGEMPLKTWLETLSDRMAAMDHQEIIFVTGKGGVGKSVVAAAMAQKRAQTGRKTLLVELGYQSFYKDYFQLEKVEYHPTNIAPQLDVALWSGPECLREYALHLLKVESIYKLFFENAVTKALINVAPALSELAILGKITSHPRKIGPPLNYDCIVVDAFATGHFLALLRAPNGMAEAVKFGPMGEQSRSIERILMDSTMSKYIVVSLPEEMPVLEGLELAEGIKKLVGLEPTHVFNRIVPVPEDVGDVTDLPPYLQSFQKYLLHLDHQKKELHKKFVGQSIRELPFVFSQDAWKIVNSLAEVAP